MTFSMIHEVAALLPFHLDDAKQVNDTFMRWRQNKGDEDQRLLNVWIYCYVYRYFLIKFAASNTRANLAFDRLVATAFADAQANLHRVRKPECFAGWVSTICRNTYVSHLRVKRSTVSLEHSTPTLAVESPPPPSSRDATFLHQSISQAIETLPGFLRDVARMRLLEHHSYSAIEDATGKALPTLRTYVNRALDHLRRNTTLQALLEEIRED